MLDLQDFDLKKYEVKSLPRAAYYVPEFISEAEERELTRRVYAAPRPKWTQLAHRRLQNWGGLPTERGMVAERLPAWLQGVVERVGAAAAGAGAGGAAGEAGAGLPAPNHVLVNEYAPGQGILPHADGALFHPVVATVSAGSHAVLRFTTPRSDGAADEGGEGVDGGEAGGREVGALWLEARSLLVVAEQLYTAHLHGIEARCSDPVEAALANLPLCDPSLRPGQCVPRATRLSFTVRHVPRTTTFKLNIGNKT